MVLWKPTRSSRTNTKKKKNVLFIIGDWNARVGSQEISGVTGKFDLGVQNEAGQRLTEFCQENALVMENTLFQQHKTRLYTWASPDGQTQFQIDYIFWSQRWRSSIDSKNKTRSWLWLRSWTPYYKFRLKLKKLGKATRPFRYDPNQIPYGYRMEETNRFNYQIRSNRVPEELWTEVCDIIQQWSKPSPRKRNAKGQNGCLRRPYK